MNKWLRVARYVVAGAIAVVLCVMVVDLFRHKDGECTCCQQCGPDSGGPPAPVSR